MEDDFLLEPESRFRRLTRWMKGRAAIGTLATIGAIIVAALLLYYPVGMAIMGRKKGETVVVTTPRGSVVKFKIMEIKAA